MFDRHRPNPALGVFETMLVLDGRPVELDAHLARLSASLAELFPSQAAPPLDVPSLMRPYGRISDGTSTPGSLRITVAPDGEDRLVARSEMREAAPGAFVPLSGEEGPIAETSLHSLVLPGGLGAHKWTDRSLLEEAQARLRESALPLLVDEDGSVLEASRANLFAVRDDILLTPPLDGRVLPGVTRMRVLELAGEIGIEAREAELSRGDLLAADDVLLTGSVRGVERVDAVDGLPLRHGGQIAGRLTAELWQSWAGAKTAPLR